jgi:hypothetical protein
MVGRLPEDREPVYGLAPIRGNNVVCVRYASGQVQIGNADVYHIGRPEVRGNCEDLCGYKGCQPPVGIRVVEEGVI